MTLAQGIHIGPFSFTIIRMLVAVGVLRVIIRGERLANGLNVLDWLMLAWAVWAVLSSIFHNDLLSALETRLGITYNACGIYFLLRIFCQSLEEAIQLCRLVAVLLLPVAAEMFYEKLAVHNLFSALGGVPATPAVRHGNVRAQGPFAHAILAGTVGAACLPLMIGLWKRHRNEALLGIMACLVMVFASSSSGPVMSALAAIFALLMWNLRHQMRVIRRLVFISYIGLELAMNAPAYYLLARIDISGGSTGWHRAALIESAFKHLDEWWIGGTDYTRHWMPTGVTWSADHTDITNFYIKMGVIGGLPLMILLILIFNKGFALVGKAIDEKVCLPLESRFMFWTFGSSLFAHAATSISVSYFDQSIIFLYLTLAAIASAWSGALTRYLENGSRVMMQIYEKIQSILGRSRPKNQSRIGGIYNRAQMKVDPMLF